MIENKDLQATLDRFAQYFPNIDFSNVTSGYEQVEKKLLPHLKEFTKEQWEVILSSEYSDLFQVGMPHLSWRDEREFIIWKLLEICKTKPCSTWNASWYKCQKYSLQLPTGVILEIVIEEPISWSGSNRTHYKIRLTDEVIPVPTHRAVILGIAEDTKAYIGSQYAGTLEECEDWVAHNIDSNHFFKIMPIE